MVAAEVDGSKVAVADDDPFWIVGLVQATADHQAAIGAGAADQLDNDLVGQERLSAPVPGDEREEAVLDPVPFGCPGGQSLPRRRPGWRTISVRPVSSAKR
jgi:hypothetical protein